MTLKVIFFLFLIQITQVLLAQENSSWQYMVTIHSNSYEQDLKFFSENDYDIAGVNLKNKSIDLLITPAQYSNLVAKNFELSITTTKGVSRGPDQKFKTPEEIEEFLFTVNRNFPEITKLEVIGTSLEGRNIYALKISDNPALSENEPNILFNSMHHAREIMTPEMGIDIIEYLTENYMNNDKVKHWVDSNEIWVMPMFNVDGNNLMWTRDQWWRKNARNGYGVDLNRNYPVGWNSCNGSSGWTGSQTYRGSEPGSEPETQVMMNFVSRIKPVFNISYHSYSELVIYPKGCSPLRTNNAEIVESIGKEIANRIDYSPGTAWELLYNADGGDIDWMHEAYQVIPYVIELNDSETGFHPNYDKWRDKTVERNRPGWQYLLERLDGPSLLVSFSSKVTSNAVLEIYKVSGKENHLLQVYPILDREFAQIILNNGSYNIILKDKNKNDSWAINVQDNRVNLKI